MILAVKELSSTTAGHRHIARSHARFGLSRLSAEIGTARFRVPIYNGVQIIGGGDGGGETLLRASIPEGVRVVGHRRYGVLVVANPIIRRCPLARFGTASMHSTVSGIRSAGILMPLSRRHARPSNREPLDARLYLMPRRILSSAPQARKARAPGHHCRLRGRAALEKATASNPAPTHSSRSIHGTCLFFLHCRPTMPRPRSARSAGAQGAAGADGRLPRTTTSLPKIAAGQGAARSAATAGPPSA